MDIIIIRVNTYDFISHMDNGEGWQEFEEIEENKIEEQQLLNKYLFNQCYNLF